jgi:hypothetical protein
MDIKLYLPENKYAVASLRCDQYQAALSALAGLEGFVSLVRDRDEITLILDEEVWKSLAPGFPEAKVQGSRRMIFFDTILDFSVVGFIAEISRALAEADISILSISTYRSDAVLVHESRFEAAVAAVKNTLMTLQITHFSRQ